MPVYVSLRFLDDKSQLSYPRKLSNRAIPARKRRKRSKRQTSYAILAVLYARLQGRFAKPVLYLGIKPGFAKSSRSWTWTLFLPQQVDIVIFALRQWFARYRPILKLPYLGMKPEIWKKKFLKLQMDHLSILGCRNWGYLHSAVIGSQDMVRFSKLQYLGMKSCNLKTVKKNCIYSFYPKGSNLSLFSLHGHRFPR